MADISLTDYSLFLNHFAESRNRFPLEKNHRVYSLRYRPASLLACFSGLAIGVEVRALRMEPQKAEYFSGVTPVHAPVSHWVGLPLPGADWRFGHYHYTPAKVSTAGEKYHAIQPFPLD